ncbi:hypothetical protein niasHT_019745 [Heterodera trifolii]|uniref:MYND-type domain-containing protein n=1 Tax=Heterodera trifolii TaxID=157864 RepID=A0ABD2LC49_9BILA
MGTSDQIGRTMPTDQSPEPIDFYPFAYALFDENLGKHCWYCLDDEKTHKRCMGCHRAMFCDQNCQMLAWKDHKFECRGIRANSGNVPNIEVRLLGRIVTRHKAIAKGMDRKDQNFYKDRQSRRNIMDIWAHTKNIEKDSFAMGKFEEIFGRLIRFYEPKALLPKDVVFELHCRDFINRHAISDKHYLREIGKGLYLDLCAYDHSCRPNTVYSCRSFVATLRPLHANVKMLDRSTTSYSYIDLLCAKQDRRKLLKDTWYFHCQCERCADNSENILTAMFCPHCPRDNAACLCPFGSSNHKDEQTQLLTCPKCGTTLKPEEVMEAIAAMRFINEILDKTDFERMGRPKALSLLEGMAIRFRHVLPPTNVYFCKIVQALLPHIDQSDNGRLLELHLLVEPCIRQCYPHNHPALAFHLRNIGIFAKEQNELKIAEKYLTEALRMFQFVMGVQHSLTTLTAAILEEIIKGEREKEIRREIGKDEKKEEKKGGKTEEEEKKTEEERKEGKTEEEEKKMEEERKKGKTEEEEKKMEEGKNEGKTEEEEKKTEEEEERKKGKTEEEEKKMEEGKNEGKTEEEEQKMEEEEKTEEEYGLGRKQNTKDEERKDEVKKEKKKEREKRKQREEEKEQKIGEKRAEGGKRKGNREKEERSIEEAQNGRGREWDGTKIILNIVPPAEEEEKQQNGGENPAEEKGEELINSLVRMSISKATGGEQAEETQRMPMPTEGEEQRIGTSVVPSSRPGSGQSGAALSPHYYSSSDGGGAKKKLKLKKGTRRKRTPLPPKTTTDETEEEEEEKSEASTMEELQQHDGKEGAKRKSREEKHRTETKVWLLRAEFGLLLLFSPLIPICCCWSFLFWLFEQMQWKGKNDEEECLLIGEAGKGQRLF